jgi:hypothetical protein
MIAELRCPECRALLPSDRTCQDFFHQMGFWELEDLEIYGVKHHLMVLCYHLQHPRLYSQRGLREAMTMLVEFIEREVTPQDMRQKLRNQVDSSTRKFKIKGTPEDHGRYQNPVEWQMTAADAVAGGIDNFIDNVQTWAYSVNNSLKASGNLPNPGSSEIFHDAKS